jgi:hypothetical protein
MPGGDDVDIVGMSPCALGQNIHLFFFCMCSTDPMSNVNNPMTGGILMMGLQVCSA